MVEFDKPVVFFTSGFLSIRWDTIALLIGSEATMAISQTVRIRVIF